MRKCDSGNGQAAPRVKSSQVNGMVKGRVRVRVTVVHNQLIPSRILEHDISALYSSGAHKSESAQPDMAMANFFQPSCDF